MSELIWLTDKRPSELTDHWMKEYSEVDTASAKMALLERHGYTPVGYFVLPEGCWIDNYYRPMQTRLEALLRKHEGSDLVHSFVAGEQAEISLYVRFSNFFGYGFFVARKCGD